jgi:hypothetical protein
MSRPSILAPFAAVTFGAAVALWPADAAAQDSPASPVPAPSAAAAPSPTPDIVKLKDGSMYRGEILELVANDHVDLRVSSGEVKRFPMSDVSFAGASAVPEAPPAPPPPTPPPTAASTAVRVQFESDTPDTEVYQKDGESVGTGYVFAGRSSGVVAIRAQQFKRVCGAPCASSLEPGTYRLAMSKGERAPVQDHESVTIDGPSRVKAKYTDNTGTRVAGWVVMGASLVAGTVMMVEAFSSSQNCTAATQYGSGMYGFSAPGSCYSTTTTNTGLLAGGGVVMGVGTLVGLVLALQHDNVTFSVTPWSASAVTSPMGGGALERSRATPEGIALRMQF